MVALTLSNRAKEAIKTALAMAIAYGIAMGMGWDKPYWAGFAVAMISLSTTGQSLHKGALRMLGTLMAVVAAFTLLALFPQARWEFLAALSVYIAVCTYMSAGGSKQYFWFVSGFVCLIIVAGSAGGGARQAFEIAVLRAQETGLGILVYSLVTVFLWRQQSVAPLWKTAHDLVETQTQLFRAYRDSMNGSADAQSLRSLRLQEIGLSRQLGQLLTAAEADSYAVWELRRQWRGFKHLTDDLLFALLQWRTSLPDMKQLDPPTYLPNVREVLPEIEARLVAVGQMLEGRSPDRSPKQLRLTLDVAETRTLNHFEKAAVVTCKAQIDRLEALSASLFDCVADIRGIATQVSAPRDTGEASPRMSLDPDRLLATARVVFTLWISYLIWIFLDPPGHQSYFQLATTIAMVVAMTPQAAPKGMVVPFAMGSVVAGIVYVFVMPQLSGYLQLACLIFGFTFAGYYIYGEPRQAFAKFGAIIPFLVLTSIQNQQSYDFSHFANSTAMIMLAIFLVVATDYLPPSPRAEKIFLRLQKRFFLRAGFLLSRTVLKLPEEPRSAGRWQIAVSKDDLLELPQKLDLYGGQIDHRMFPENTPAQVGALVKSLDVLAHRIKILTQAREAHQANYLVRELHPDARAWRLAVQKMLDRWASDPGATCGSDLRERLAARLANMEARINETFAMSERESLSDEDYENFYRVLGAYRAVSSAAIAHAELAEGVNWTHWKEPRF